MQAYASSLWNDPGESSTVFDMARRKHPNTGHEAVAERLRLTREALDLTQASLGRLAGISAQAWNNYERGLYRISIDQAVRLCITTGVTLDWIYRGEMRGLPFDLVGKIQQLTQRSRSA